MDEPKIAERVKFWQEQDRINRELIPRVIKNHELLAKHVESHEEGDSLARAQIGALEARVAEGDSLVRAQIETLEARVEEGDSLTRAQIERLEARVAELERPFGRGLVSWVPYAGLALALAALILALVT